MAANNIKEEDALHLLDSMDSQGSRYANIEQNTCPGMTLVLGQELSESHWTKLLPKTGKKFQDVMQVLNRTGTVNTARGYTELRNTLVDWYLKDIGFQCNRAGGRQTSTYSGIAGASSLHHTQALQDYSMGLSSGYDPLLYTGSSESFMEDFDPRVL
ncbi:hypothetical protein K431DRAFT_305035 [Polychaeton citri CBS 116435]|uniref:Uncharacterized protein n=1 Tax=Polychaeton citri CBS 116435 TaxID=1314669 RepID=A0A9P4UKZ3_9PEZI|nr:hypothetical protein K431DRAFT_305035 [Polychaeton citri CBS 116435]